MNISEHKIPIMCTRVQWGGYLNGKENNVFLISMVHDRNVIIFLLDVNIFEETPHARIVPTWIGGTLGPPPPAALPFAPPLAIAG
jgi:hypothetical protein